MKLFLACYRQLTGNGLNYQGKQVSVEIVWQRKLHRLIVVTAENDGIERLSNEINMRKIFLYRILAYYLFSMFFFKANFSISENDNYLWGILVLLIYGVLRVHSLNFSLHLQVFWHEILVRQVLKFLIQFQLIALFHYSYPGISHSLHARLYLDAYSKFYKFFTCYPHLISKAENKKLSRPQFI